MTAHSVIARTPLPNITNLTLFPKPVTKLLTSSHNTITKTPPVPIFHPLLQNHPINHPVIVSVVSYSDKFSENLDSLPNGLDLPLLPATGTPNLPPSLLGGVSGLPS